MTSTGSNGRLGNQIIRNIAVSLLAEKHDLHVTYYNKELIDALGIPLYSGSTIFRSTLELNDKNYFTVYNGTLHANLNPNNAFFQTKQIMNVLYAYLRTDAIRTRIMNCNPFKLRYNENNDLFVHIRLADAAKWNPGVEYYIRAIRTISHDNLYISTDEHTHAIIQTLCNLYPHAKLVEYDEVTTLQFASTCKRLLLSHGSYSALIGYLGFYSTVYYPEHDHRKRWYGDLFSIQGWTALLTRHT